MRFSEYTDWSAILDWQIWIYIDKCKLELIPMFCSQAALKKSNLELEAELKVHLNNIEMLNEAVQMKDNIIKVTVMNRK